ncbi:hypothetical protein CK203_114713 [Vitis vinifera]|uniref:Uncharacterized protein n=1 Tax=Vitis vinifera TaxID=29760 RepID=A0A438CC31_VITVI|nr:hypothetical protein CK203_114713 [Vitis vinifera]
MKYLDDTLRCPLKPAANSSVSAMALYTHWYRHDQLLLNAIFASVSKAVMPLIGMTTTSRARIMQLKEDLTLIQQGSHTVFEFHHAIKLIYPFHYEYDGQDEVVLGDGTGVNVVFILWNYVLPYLKLMSSPLS